MRPKTLTNTKTKVFTKIAQTNTHPHRARIHLMLATTIQLPNTTPHHQDGATTTHTTSHPTTAPGVASGPNSVPAALLLSRRNCCCAPSPHPLRATGSSRPTPSEVKVFFVVLLRKEVIQPHLPVRLPCYDFVPIADPTFDSSPHKG